MKVKSLFIQIVIILVLLPIMIVWGCRLVKSIIDDNPNPTISGELLG